ncbi:hypothetical protein EST38_g6534 [Candolleomyces aberdarensis]|uniref:Uncharacterized protein n=1 Tax=Candolleomyces aberdarensis TaxID=2316362 RepID=A0A4Q2DHE8_9AGAR|nr:hypothetical protein EST38_g6534 [Candolleomyces aberdarensis]
MASPFQSHLNTNYSPSDIEKLQIKQFVKALQDELKGIDTELEELQSRLVATANQLNPTDVGLTEVEQRITALSTEREQQIHSIEQHIALLNPIHGIPIDILQSIFERCVKEPVPFASTELDTDPMSPSFCPMLLTFVCSGWRRVALDCPSLWDKPYIFLPEQKSARHARWIESLKNCAQLIRLWLSRAGIRPLTIAVSSPQGLETNDGFRAIEEAIISFSPQWKRLRVDGSNCILQTLLSLPASSVPNLEFVDFTYSLFPGADGVDAAIGRPNCLISSPSLRGVRLAGGSLRKFQLIPLPWSQLRDIRFSRLIEPYEYPFNDREVLGLLERCPRLQRCELYAPKGCVLQEARYDNPVILRHLTHLEFHQSVNEDFMLNTTVLFLSLELPALTTLKYLSLVGAEPLGALLQRCAGTLRHLDLRIHAISARELLHMLAQTVHLESLKVAHPLRDGRPSPLLTDELLEALTPPTHEEESHPAAQSFEFHCPSLRNIVLHVTKDPQISDKAIFNFIRGRRELERPTLQHVEISHPYHRGQGDVVAMLREHGVNTGDMTLGFLYGLGPGL